MRRRLYRINLGIEVSQSPTSPKATKTSLPSFLVVEASCFHHLNLFKSNQKPTFPPFWWLHPPTFATTPPLKATKTSLSSLLVAEASRQVPLPHITPTKKATNPRFLRRVGCFL
jgi:hypothetical protein